MKLLCHFCLLFFLLLVNIQLKAQDTSAMASNVFVPAMNEPLQSLQNDLWVQEDKDGKLHISDFLQKKVRETAFHKTTTEPTLNPFSVWWCKINIVPSFSSNDFLIGIPFNAFSGMDNGNDIAEVWIIKNNQIIYQYHTGNLNPASQRPIASPVNQNLFPIELIKGEAVSIYWRIKKVKDFSPPQLHFALQHKNIISPSSYITRHKNIGQIALIYLGIMSILFFFGLVFFLITRQTTFIWFTLMAACLGLHVMLLHPANYLTQWLFPEHPVLQFHAFSLLTGLFNMSVLLFTRAFLNTRQILPLWNKIILVVIVIACLVSFSQNVLIQVNPRFHFPFFAYLLVFISSLLIGLRLITVKNLFSQWMGAALLWLSSFQLFGGTFLSNQLLTWLIAQVGMMIIIFFALAYRFNQSAQEKAEAEKLMGMDKIKSRFFANISHEFRTPLTLIQGPLQHIEEQAVGSREAATVPLRHIKTMRRHTDRLLELVNQLLDLSKLDSGKMKLQIIKGDVLQMMKVLTASFESMAERKGIHYHTHFPEQTIIAFFDKDKLDKIVCNLLGNAFKFTPEQGTVSAIIETEENRLRISVDDNGPGIPKKEVDKVFDRFYQVEGTEDKGSGIGLALVKELVDLYRGQISVSSEPGKGSRFKVSLPMDKNSFKEDEIIYGEWKDSQSSWVNKSLGESDENTFIQKTASLQLPLILVVEDNADLRSFICETVQQNYQVIQAANGKEGLEKAIAEIPDVIVSDVMMPIMDGFAMIERLKKDELTNHIPIILLTAKAGQLHKLEGLETGADDYLLKPFESKELLTRIQNLVNQRKLLRKKFAGEITLKPSEVSVNSADGNFLNKVMEAIEANMEEEDFGVEQLSKEVAMSRSQLHRKLVALTGQAPSEVLRNTRLLRAKELLQKKSATPSEVAYKVGFNSHTYFSKCFREEFGISPSEV